MGISERANSRISDFESKFSFDAPTSPTGPFYAGVDLGTTYIVTALVDHEGTPAAGVLTRSQSTIRDGLVLDYVGALSILRRQIDTLHKAGFHFDWGGAAFPPGTTGRNVETYAHILRSMGMEVAGLIDEPTAASLALEIEDGAVVDVGGGTTGISVLREGEVVYTADEPTGGIHVDLVLAGHFRISVEEAERVKRDPEQQGRIYPLIRPVFQKMASIVSRHLQGHSVDTLYLVGGTCCFPGIKDVMESETGLPVVLPVNPLLVTPLGIALSCCRMAKTGSPPS